MFNDVYGVTDVRKILFSEYSQQTRVYVLSQINLYYLTVVYF